MGYFFTIFGFNVIGNVIVCLILLFFFPLKDVLIMGASMLGGSFIMSIFYSIKNENN